MRIFLVLILVSCSAFGTDKPIHLNTEASIMGLVYDCYRNNKISDDNYKFAQVKDLKNAIVSGTSGTMCKSLELKLNKLRTTK